MKTARPARAGSPFRRRSHHSWREPFPPTNEAAKSTRPLKPAAAGSLTQDAVLRGGGAAPRTLRMRFDHRTRIYRAARLWCTKPSNSCPRYGETLCRKNKRSASTLMVRLDPRPANPHRSRWRFGLFCGEPGKFRRRCAHPTKQRGQIGARRRASVQTAGRPSESDADTAPSVLEVTAFSQLRCGRARAVIGDHEVDHGRLAAPPQAFAVLVFADRRRGICRALLRPEYSLPRDTGSEGKSRP